MAKLESLQLFDKNLADCFKDLGAVHKSIMSKHSPWNSSEAVDIALLHNAILKLGVAISELARNNR